MDQAQTQVMEKPCSICGKAIDSTKLRIHEATCARNNYKCPKCNEIVSKSEKEHHDQEFHELIKCEYCKEFEAEKQFLKDHKDYCVKKPLECQYCELVIDGDKYEEHIGYCGSKTQKCPECNQNIQMKEMHFHQSSNQCSVMKEMERNKAFRELEKFQEEEEKKIKEKFRVNEIQQRQQREERYIQEQMKAQNKTKVVNYEDGRTYVKKNTAGAQQLNPTPPKKQNALQPKNESPGNDHDMDAELIAKLMQEDADHIEAQNYNESVEDLGDQNNYQQQNVRAPDQFYQEQLIGGSQPIHFTRSTHQQLPGGGFAQGFSTTFQSSSHHFNTGGHQMPSNFNMDEDSYMHNDFNEDDEMKRAIQESLGGGPKSGQQNVLPSAVVEHGDDLQSYEDQILQQMLEESKKHL